MEVLAYAVPLCSELQEHCLECVDVGLLNGGPLGGQPQSQLVREREVTVHPVCGTRLSVDVDWSK